MKQPPSTSPDLKPQNLAVQLLTAGTSACIADLLTFPLDTAKVRLQVQGEGGGSVLKQIASQKSMHPPLHPLLTTTTKTATTIVTNTIPQIQYRGIIGTISTIVSQEGPRALYNGLSAGLQRQMCFASVRLGLYDPVKNFYQSIIKENPEGLQIFTRVLAGITTGGMAVLIAQPTDVVKVRFQAQKKVNNLSELRYKSTTQAYISIHREEGVRGLWKGSVPNIGRNAIVNVTETVCYDIIKDCLLLYANMKDNIYCHFTAAFFAGLATTVASSPVDVIKTRFMNSPKGKYKSSFDCMMQMARKEGASAFYKGFSPNFARMVTWNIALWLTYEQLKKLIYTKNVKD